MSIPEPEDLSLRFVIIGLSGAGKSTLAKRLSDITGLPHLPLDTLYYQPGWIQNSPSEMKANASKFMETNRSWIIDGNYFGKIGTFTLDHATHIIWLDPPFWRVYPQLVYRTILRLFRLAPTCAPGCDERLDSFYAKDGLLRWAWDTGDKNRAKFATLVEDDPRLVRFTGWGYLGKVDEWLKDVSGRYSRKGM